jgi:hypothetical protein
LRHRMQSPTRGGHSPGATKIKPHCGQDEDRGADHPQNDNLRLHRRRYRVQASGCPRTASGSTCSVIAPWRAVAIPASVRHRVRHRCGAVGRACRFGQARLRMCYYFVFRSASCPPLRAGAKICRRYAPASGEAKYGDPAGSHVASAKQQMATCSANRCRTLRIKRQICLLKESCRTAATSRQSDAAAFIGFAALVTLALSGGHHF